MLCRPFYNYCHNPQGMFQFCHQIEQTFPGLCICLYTSLCFVTVEAVRALYKYFTHTHYTLYTPSLDGFISIMMYVLLHGSNHKWTESTCKINQLHTSDEPRNYIISNTRGLHISTADRQRKHLPNKLQRQAQCSLPRIINGRHAHSELLL